VGTVAGGHPASRYRIISQSLKYRFVFPYLPKLDELCLTIQKAR
jgi:hypothetical protein